MAYKKALKNNLKFGAFKAHYTNPNLRYNTLNYLSFKTSSGTNRGGNCDNYYGYKFQETLAVVIER